MAMAMPVLPEVGSMMVLDGSSRPDASARGIMYQAGGAVAMGRSRTTGVLPMQARIPWLPLTVSILRSVVDAGHREGPAYGGHVLSDGLADRRIGRAGDDPVDEPGNLFHLCLAPAAGGGAGRAEGHAAPHPGRAL